MPNQTKSKAVWTLLLVQVVTSRLPAIATLNQNNLALILRAFVIANLHTGAILRAFFIANYILANPRKRE